MSTKEISLVFGITLFVSTIFLSLYSIYSYGNESLEPYQQQARDADLILRGKVISVNEKEGDQYYQEESDMHIVLLGPDNRPVTMTRYQNVTLDVIDVMKGSLTSNQFVFTYNSLIHAQNSSLSFSVGEEVIVMLKQYEGEDHQTYYSPNNRQGKYFIVEQDYPNPGETLIDNPGIPNGEMPLADFLASIY